MTEIKKGCVTLHQTEQKAGRDGDRESGKPEIDRKSSKGLKLKYLNNPARSKSNKSK